MEQFDRHDKYLTVRETLDFAFKCRRGGTHRYMNISKDPANESKIAELDEENWFVNLMLQSLGLGQVAETFVGDDVTVRGVSGGERRRVSLGEMACAGTPIMCLDEISTGLDGTCSRSSTYFAKSLFVYYTNDPLCDASSMLQPQVPSIFAKRLVIYAACIRQSKLSRSYSLRPRQ